MINRRFLVGFGTVALAVSTVLSGCGGSGSQSGAINPSTTNVGIITGFGSVYVNGIEYDSSSASIHVDGVSGNDDYDLSVGMMVSVTGSVNPDGVTGTATSITFVDDLEGVVLSSAIAADGTGTLNVMGQTVTVTGTTVFESHVSGITSVDGIVAGNIIEVSGHSSGSGSIYATRIEVKAADLAGYQVSYPGMELELKGVVSALDTTNQTFTIGNLIVDYSLATQVSSNLSNGLYVEVTGTIPPVDNGDGTFTFTAHTVEQEDDGIKGVSGDEGDETELNGVITSIDNMPTSFELDGQTIILANNTEFEGDLQPGFLKVGDSIQVEGQFDASDQLIAHSIQPQEDGSSLVEYKDYVLSIDTVNGTLTLQGGQVIRVTNTTIFQDSLDVNADHYLDLSALRPGDYVEIHATTDSGGNLVAVKLERDDAPII